MHQLILINFFTYRLRIAQEIKREQDEIEVAIKDFELRGVEIEKDLRGEDQDMELLNESSRFFNCVILRQISRSSFRSSSSELPICDRDDSFNNSISCSSKCLVVQSLITND